MSLTARVNSRSGVEGAVGGRNNPRSRDLARSELVVWGKVSEVPTESEWRQGKNVSQNLETGHFTPPGRLQGKTHRKKKKTTTYEEKERMVQ